MSAFETWTTAGVKFIAFPMNSGFGIVDEEGGWYGAWQDVAAFRKQWKQETAESLRLSMTARLTVQAA